MSELQTKIDADIKTAMKAGDKVRLSSLRMMKTALTKREMDSGAALSADDAIAVLTAMVRQRRESIEQFKAGGRDQLVAQEEAELAVVLSFLPQPLDADELSALVGEALRETGAASPRDMGKVMQWLKPRVQGRADGKQLSDLVKTALQNAGKESAQDVTHPRGNPERDSAAH